MRLAGSGLTLMGVAASIAHAVPNEGPASGGAGAAGVPARIDAAFQYLFPLFEFARTRFNVIEAQGNPRRGAVNRLGHRRTLADHRTRSVTTPNNDTLYTSGWLDLSGAPLRLDVPRIEGRYWSVALMDVFTNNFAMIGSRLDGAGPVGVLLAGPGWRGEPEPGSRVIRAPSNDVWLLGRWLVDGPEDAPAVHAIQDALRLTRVQGETKGEAAAAAAAAQTVAPRDSRDPGNFLAVVNEMLARNPVPAGEAAMLAGWADLGVKPGEIDAWSRLDEPVRAAWRARIGPAHAALSGGIVHGGPEHGGWSYPAPEIGNFGAHYGLRAAVALGGLAALEPIEALYLALSVDRAGEPLSGARRYRLAMPPGGLETDAFWSLTLYELMPDGRLFFVESPSRRYSVGDRSGDLRRNPDGSIDLLIQREEPPPRDRGNWLPAPRGEFRLILRAYQPRAALLEGRAPLPRLERLDDR